MFYGLSQSLPLSMGTKLVLFRVCPKFLHLFFFLVPDFTKLWLGQHARMSGIQSLLSHGREPPRASLAKVSFSQGCTLPTEGQLNLGKTPVHRHHHPPPPTPELWEGSEETGIPEGPEDQPPYKRGNRPKHRLRPAQGHTPSTRGKIRG